MVLRWKHGYDVTLWSRLRSQITLLHRISSIVSSELSLDEMLGEIVGLTAQVTECDACLVYLLEHDTDEIVSARLSGAARRCARQSAHEDGRRRHRLGGGAQVRCGALHRTRAADRRFKRFPALMEDTYEAFLSVPLVSGGDVIGVINVHHREPHEHTLGRNRRC